MGLLIILLILAAWIGSAVLREVEIKRSERFDHFCAANSRRLLCGEECEFEGRIYTINTRLVEYSWCVSIFTVTLTRGTAIHHADDKVIFALVMLITLFGGWWGIPWGPVRTVKSLIDNASTFSEPFTMRSILTR
ncbi:MAG: hypothetical protein ACI4J5_01535 [Oscillospiraceae bacterium]